MAAAAAAEAPGWPVRASAPKTMALPAPSPLCLSGVGAAAPGLTGSTGFRARRQSRPGPHPGPWEGSGRSGPPPPGGLQAPLTRREAAGAWRRRLGSAWLFATAWRCSLWADEWPCWDAFGHQATLCRHRSGSPARGARRGTEPRGAPYSAPVGILRGGSHARHRCGHPGRTRRLASATTCRGRPCSGRWGHAR